MKAEIKNNLDNPEQLERMYRNDKTTFKREFNLVYPEIQETATAQCWNARLNFDQEAISWGTSKELTLVLAACFIAGLVAKIPDFAGIEPDYFYARNLSFIVLPLLTAYFAWKRRIQTKSVLIVSAVFLVSVAYINLLPDDAGSDTLILACIHLPLFLWAVMGFTFVGQQPNSSERRLDFLQYNADLVVMITIMVIAGGLLTAVTFGLFELIDIKIEEFYSHYVLVWGIPAAPIIGTYLVRENPQLTNKISPVIAKIFTPLVLVVLLVYLSALIFTGKNPYNDREFLLTFNLLLSGVMAIILFSIAETPKNADGRIGTILLFALSAVTIIINSIALSAIVFRISEWGITPNRLAVLGGNVLMLTNLLMMAYRLLKAMKNKDQIERVKHSIAFFLPVYCVWAIFVTFVVPAIFNFK